MWTGHLLGLALQIDYFERAKRLEEIPLIKKAYEEQRIKDMELWELQEEERVSCFVIFFFKGKKIDIPLNKEIECINMRM